MPLDTLNPDLETLRLRHQLIYDSYDALGQSLTALNIQLQTALKLWEANPEQAHTFVTVAYAQGLAAMQEVRRSMPLLDVPLDPVLPDPVAIDSAAPDTVPLYEDMADDSSVTSR